MKAAETVTAGPSNKKAKVSEVSPFSIHEENIQLRNALRQHWSTDGTCSERNGLLTIAGDPFKHVEIGDFISETESLKEMVRKLDKVEFVEKSSDLFKFKQSNDLVSVPVTDVQGLRTFFETSVLDFLTQVTDLPLDGKVDMFLSEYLQTDFLLCHDDELESRRIAFILYLSEDWDSSYGGSLDLFASSKEIEPLEIVKSIVPAFNKFVFFNVTATSFHQVAEIVNPNARRLALSGWFYGNPLPRPVISFPAPESYPLIENLSKTESLEKMFTAEYSNSSNYPAINASLEEYSVAKLKLLLRSAKYDQLLESLNGKNKPIHWQKSGAANLCSYLTTEQLLPNRPKDLPQPIQDLIGVMLSEDFFKFLEKVTEFDIRVSTSRVAVSLRRFQHKSYILLKTVTDDMKEEEEEEIYEIEPASENEVELNESSSDGDQQPETLVRETESESDEEEDDDSPAEMEIDVIYFFGSFDWKDSFGGQTIYVDGNGQQLLTVTPEQNTLAIVVREKKVRPYVSYVNCLAEKQMFHALSLTIAGFKETDES